MNGTAIILNIEVWILNLIPQEIKQQLKALGEVSEILTLQCVYLVQCAENVFSMSFLLWYETIQHYFLRSFGKEPHVLVKYVVCLAKDQSLYLFKSWYI